MNFDEFKQMVMVSMDDIYVEIFRNCGLSIKIKKEKVAVRNLARIFDATLKLANEKGFHAMSLRDLCRESGLSMGALYNYFSGKDELLILIREQGRAVVARAMKVRLDGLDDPREQLAAAIRTHLYLSEIMQPWFFFSYMETRFFNKSESRKAVSGELQTEKIFTDILEKGNAQGVFNIREPVMIASAVKALLQDWYLKRWKYAGRCISVDAYADFLMSLVGSFINIKDA